MPYIGNLYAVSVTMKNTGSVSWTPSLGYKLGQKANGAWIPYPSVGFTGSVTPGNSRTFNFNLKHIEPELIGNNECTWQMKQNSVFFGDENGKTVYVSGSGKSFHESLLNRLFAWVAPRELQAGAADGEIFQQGEVVQVLRAQDHRIDPADVEAAGKYVLRYEASLAGSWDVDYYFRVEYDAKSFSVGDPIRGARGQNHSVEVVHLAPGEVLVRATRTGQRGLSGKGTILEIPFELKEGVGSPSTLLLVELVTTK